MKSYILICLVVLSSIGISFAKDAALETVTEHGRLSVNGVNLVDENGEIVQLKGMSLFWSIWYPQYYNKRSIDGIHLRCHSNVVRAAITVDTLDGGYLTDPETQLQDAYAVIEAAILDDIYVIVDWHEEQAYKHLKEAQEFFGNISRRYGGYPNIIYETFNEPTQVSWSDILKPYHEAVINTIRQNDPNNVIILGTPQWSQLVEEAAADPVTNQTNIMYTLHFYAGTHKQWLRDSSQRAIDKGLPIFVTEYGTVNSDGDGDVDADESRLWWDWLDENDISYVNWSISDKLEGASALLPNTTARQVCREEYLTESGLLVVEQNKS
nr:glycoside hydrolase family 5 subfamily 2 [Anisarthron barbipes]